MPVPKPGTGRQEPAEGGDEPVLRFTGAHAVRPLGLDASAVAVVGAGVSSDSQAGADDCGSFDRLKTGPSATLRTCLAGSEGI